MPTMRFIGPQPTNTQQGTARSTLAIMAWVWPSRTRARQPPVKITKENTPWAAEMSTIIVELSSAPPTAWLRSPLAMANMPMSPINTELTAPTAPQRMSPQAGQATRSSASWASGFSMRGLT